MKTSTKFYTAILAATFLVTSMGTLNAAGGQGNNNSIPRSSSQVTTVQNIATSRLSEQEKLDIAYQYSEEMVARDAYNYFYTLYGTPIFKTIAVSEQVHMDDVKILLDRYNIEIPASYGELTSTFTALKAEGEIGLKQALEVGIKIEILDIKDIVDTTKTSDNQDVKIILTNIGGASYNHMRGFINTLANNNLTTTINYSDYLSPSDLNTRGNIGSKLSEKLASEGVVLPEQVNPTSMQQKDIKDQENMNTQGRYKDAIDKRYGNTIRTLNTEKLQVLDTRVDQAIQKVEQSTSISETIKENYLNIYYALKDYISGLFR
ncbi:MAG: DUF2202 domain-containing protein [Candidatus Gracilibacteria bacterium]